MSGISIFITNQGILVADGAATATALQQQFGSAIASGKVTQIVINKANDGNLGVRYRLESMRSEQQGTTVFC